MTNLTRALLVAAALGCAALAGCVTTGDESAAREPERQTAGEVVDDSVVTAKVKAKLVDDPVTKAYQINVETFKGTVQLSGFVESDETRTRALQLARDVDGVKRVKDAMEVRRGS